MSTLASPRGRFSSYFSPILWSLAHYKTAGWEQSWYPQTKWEVPPAGWLKCNVDGAFYEQQWRGTTGLVLHDDAGAFVRGGTNKWYNNCLDALSMEAMACRDGLLMARQVVAQRIWLESDYQFIFGKLGRANDQVWCLLWGKFRIWAYSFKSLSFLSSVENVIW